MFANQEIQPKGYKASINIHDIKGIMVNDKAEIVEVVMIKQGKR